jgi:hypothetical protein
MKTLSSLLFASLALVAAPVVAQTQDAILLQKPRVLELPMGRADFGFVLLAMVRAEVRIADQSILADALALPIVRKPNQDSADVMVPRDLDLWSQVILCEDGLLTVSPIRLERAPKPAVEPTIEPTEERLHVLVADALPIQLTPGIVSGRYVAMKATFEAPSNGYGLKLFDVQVRDGVADVWLWRLLPADGGHARIQQDLSVKAEFAPVRAVRVFLAEGTGAPSADAEFRLLARFPQ